MAEVASPDVLVYVCANCIPQAGRLPRQWIQGGARILVQEVPCSGKMDGRYLFHAYEAAHAAFALWHAPKGSATWPRVIIGPRFAFEWCKNCWPKWGSNASGVSCSTAPPKNRSINSNRWSTMR